ncbi:hypothetical protein [Robertkochia solimangrovi]|uniref:hypothetical protein n=1 Tax=Robertkochia solimangrovi TaxID=2213046 RepID=UPI0011803888|nr:hypothetical protein [Robertkochia solimangrovi]TRZ46301.1 hypothetical protein DMZ48_03335 [Robertkochia solimangrovi]
MKITIKLAALLLIFTSFLTTETTAQENEPFITVTTRHWNMDLKDFDRDEWLSMEKQFQENVIDKNELIMGGAVYTHRYTPDNTEIVFVNVYRTWEDIEKADARNSELIKAAWPDETQRKAFFEKLAKYYSVDHSDEIYSMLPGAKMLPQKPTDPQILYVQIHEMAYPEEGSEKEFMDMYTSFTDAIKEAGKIKAFYPHRHRWGADSREFVEAYLFDSMDDLDNFGEDLDKMFEAKYPDEAERKKMGEAMGKYFTGKHRDYIYTQVPELTKVSMANSQ